MERLINRRRVGDLGEASAIEWFIRAGAVVCTPLGHSPGGPKYSEFEIDSTGPIDNIVYGAHGALLDSTVAAGEYPSGQRMATVNRPAQPSQVRILPPPSNTDRPSYERRLGRSRQAVIWPKRRVTVPLAPFEEAGLGIGDRMRVSCDGTGRVLLERITENGPPGGGPFQQSFDGARN